MIPRTDVCGVGRFRVTANHVPTSSGWPSSGLAGCAGPAPELEQRAKQRQATEALVAKISEEKHKIIRLEVEIEQRRHLVEKKLAAIAGASAEDIAGLKSEITAQKSKIRQAEDDLIIANGQLEALQRSRPT